MISHPFSQSAAGDVGRPVLGDAPDEAEARPAPAPAAKLPDMPECVGESPYAHAVAALRHLIDYAQAKGLAPGRASVGVVSIEFAGPASGATRITGLGQAEAQDLYRQYGGPLYDELVARLSKQTDTPR